MRLPKQIFVATQPISLHLSFDRLAHLVRDVLGGDPRVGQAFLFHNRRATHVKLLWHDGTGYRVLYKRLDRGREQDHPRARGREVRAAAGERRAERIRPADPGSTPGPAA